MNCKKIALGGLVAGIAMNIVDFIVNGILLGERWKAESALLNIDPWKTRYAMAGWIATDLIGGFVLVWIYAAIRPRYGAGPKTAIRAGIMQYLVCLPLLFSYWFTGLYSIELMMMVAIGGIFATLAAALAGCSLYKEG